MKRFLSILFLFSCVIMMQAQNIVVQSFRMDESDLTANTAGTIVMDQNGQKCALIKVETTQRDFSFDTGSLGVLKTIQKVGEIWVYVPEGVKRLTISHQLLGVLRDYDLGQTLKRAKTYILQLATGEVQTTVRQSRTSQYVVFYLTPPNAVVELDGELLNTSGGMASKMKRFGTYGYRVIAPDYKPQVGTVTVNDPQNKHIINVSLNPNFSEVTLTVDNDAEIWVNGEYKGNGSWTGNLGAGTYEFETRKQNYRSATALRDIESTSEPQTIRLQAPTPVYGEADINSMPAMADIFIDGKKVGQTPQLVSNLLAGEHQVKISKQGYKDYTSMLVVTENQTSSFGARLEKLTEEEIALQASTAAPVQPSANTTVPAQPVLSAVSTSTQRILSFTVGNVSFNMNRVDGGMFTMGGTVEQGSDADDDEKPVHQVTLSPYYLGESEVTQELWEAIMGNNPSGTKGAHKPIENVSWDDCQEFIQKLNEKTGQRFRLPTEAEWEFAAREGNIRQGYKYSGSNSLDDVAWYGGASYKSLGRVKTREVMKKEANALGIYDMSGNVNEWCQDWYGKYTNEPQVNPSGPSSGFYRVYRGGSLTFRAKDCRVSSRRSLTPDSRISYIGLRLAL